MSVFLFILNGADFCFLEAIFVSFFPLILKNKKGFS